MDVNYLKMSLKALAPKIIIDMCYASEGPELEYDIGTGRNSDHHRHYATHFINNTNHRHGRLRPARQHHERAGSARSSGITSSVMLWAGGGF